MSSKEDLVVHPDGLGPLPDEKSWIPVAVVLIGGAVLLAAALWAWDRHRLGRVGAERAWLTEGREGDRVELVSGARDVYLHVRLIDVPLGERLELECEWFGPAGTILRHNRYRTREVERDPWPTHCQHSLGSDAPLGSWSVHMTLAGRPLAEKSFEVR